MKIGALFLVKLCQVQNMRRSVASDELTKFWSTISKYATLTIVGVITTMSSIVVIGATSWVSLIAVDTRYIICLFFALFSFFWSRYRQSAPLLFFALSYVDFLSPSLHFCSFEC